MVTTTAAFALVGASPPAAAARRHASTRASARRWSLVRMSDPVSVEGCGAASGPRIASRTACPSGSSRSRYSAIPSSGYGWDSDRPYLSRSSRRWNSPSRPYFAMTCGRSARIWRRPVGRGDRDEPEPAPSPHTPGSSGATACPSQSARQPRYGPGPAWTGPPRAARRCRAWRPPRPPSPAQPPHRPGKRRRTPAPTPPTTPHPRPGRPRGTAPWSSTATCARPATASARPARRTAAPAPDPTWCNRPTTRRTTGAAATSAARSTPKLVPSVKQT